MGGEFVEVAQDEARHQPHQVADLLFGALPVFRRKGIERHRLDAEVAGGAHDRPHRFHPRAMAGDARQVRSEEHTSELQSLMRISYAVFCWKKKNTSYTTNNTTNTD